jgi:hypothetical protein
MGVKQGKVGLDKSSMSEVLHSLLTLPPIISLSILRQAQDGERSRTANVERGTKGEM